MPRLTKMILAFLGLWFLLGCAAAPTTIPDATKTDSPTETAQFVLPGLINPDHRQYLGIETREDFALSAIRTRVLIIEVFNFYCQFCQNEAPSVNKLYWTIAMDPKLREHIKLIGIGVSNTTYEVDRFREKYNIPFPLFADRSRQLAHQLETRRTPTFIGYVRESDGTLRRFLHAPGSMGDVHQFLAKVIRLADIEIN